MNRKVRYLIFFVVLTFILACQKKEGGESSSPVPGDTTAPRVDVPPVDSSIPSSTITWDNNAKKISHEVGYAEYGRIHRIDGDTLLLTYHCGSVVPNFFGVDIAVRKSVDNGKTWSDADIVVDGSQPGYYGFQNPELLVLKNGWIMLAFVGRGKPDDNAHDNVQICISKDSGNTWSSPQIVTSGRSWEPALIQLPDGEIELFYSSEAKWFPSNDVQQEILMIHSSDNGASWSNPRSVAYSSGNRDGMPVPIVLKDRKGIVFSIESINNSMSPWIIWSSVDAKWKYNHFGTTENKRRWSVEVKSIYGTAPYLIQLPNGETVLSVQYPGGRNIGGAWKKNTMAVFVGNSIASHFTNVSYPWPSLPEDEGAYFSSLFLKDNHTIVLVTTRNFPDGHSEIWWKKGRINE